jgi:D-alanyl-D-alanine carboxypeptidase (penicillin-binding protein 5/6)
MKNPTLKEIVGTKMMTVTSIDGQHIHELKNLNDLLSDTPGVIGIKTGQTDNAGECLVAYTSRDHDLITVVLKSNDRFADSRALISWAFTHLQWK